MDGKLLRWIRKQAYSGKVTKLVTKHLSARNKVQAIHESPLDTSMDDAALENVASEIDDAAFQDATGIGGTQSYVVFALSEDDKPMGRFPFRVSGEDDSDGFESSETPDSRGLTIQAMRHTEATTRLMLANIGSILRHHVESSNRQSELVEKLLSDKIASLEAVEAAMTLKHQREQEAAESARRGRLQERAFEQFAPLVGVITNKLTGKPSVETPEGVAAVETLRESLTEEQIAGMASVLSQTQMIALIEILKAEKADKSRNGAS